MGNCLWKSSASNDNDENAPQRTLLTESSSMEYVRRESQNVEDNEPSHFVSLTS